MTYRFKASTTHTLVCCVVLVAGASVAVSQEGVGEEGIIFRFTQSLEYSDNPDFVDNPTNAGFTAKTRLGFSMLKETAGQVFRFGGTTNYSAGAAETGFDNTDLDLFYSRFNRNTRFNLRGRYRNVDVDDVFNILDPINQNTQVPPIGPTGILPGPVIETGDGTREDFDYGFTYIIGEDAPVRFAFNLDREEIKYSDTTDPDLFDSITDRIGGTVRFRLNPTTDLSVFASRIDYDAEDIPETERETTVYGVRMATDISPSLRLTSSLAHREINRDTNSTTEMTVREGLDFDLGVRQLVRNGSVGADINTINTINGRRNTASIFRSMELPRGASFDLSVGILNSEVGSARGIVSFDYEKALKNGSFKVGLAQDAETSSNEEEVVVSVLDATYNTSLTPSTRLFLRADITDENGTASTLDDRRRIQLRANLNTTINSVSSWSAGLRFSDTDVPDSSSASDQRRYGIRLGYQHAITKDWSLVSAIEHSLLERDSSDDRTENAISIGLSRSFSF